MQAQDKKNLKKRYLIWLYKTTKEAVDRIERKFTQLEVDRRLLKEMKSLDKNKRAGKFIAAFQEYMANKEKKGNVLKFEAKNLKPDYHFLVIKLKVIEKVITRECGNQALAKIKSLYEKEMTERILKSTEHK